MDSRIDSIYKAVYRNENVWYNDVDNGLWNKKIICLLGFEDEIKSGKELIISLITTLSSRGANIVKYPNKNLDTKFIETIDYYICNYGLGYDIRPLHVLDYKFTTPIWLYSCNRDNVIYNTDILPIFKANRTFYCLKFINSNIKLSIIGASFINDLKKAIKPTKHIKYNLDTLIRFIRHCGFKFIHYNDIKNDLVEVSGTTYFLLCRSLDKDIDPALLTLTDKIPCISIQWLYDTYINGDLEDFNKYLVKLESFNNTQQSISTTSTQKKRKTKEVKKTVYSSCVLCISYMSAVENDLNISNIKELGALNVYIVNPIYILAPWAIDDIKNDLERKMYNTLSLIDDKQLIIVISSHEAKNNAIGLFAELSMLIKDTKGNKKIIRNITIFKSLLSINDTPTSDNIITIPNELLEGNSIINFKDANNNHNFNLYDLADSITFVEIENLSQHQYDTIEETNRQIYEK